VNDLLPSVGASILSNTGPSSIGSRMISKYQMWNAMTYRERALFAVFDQLTVAATNNGIAAVIVEESKSMYKRISEMKISRGENRAAIIASCVFMACKTNRVPRSLREIAAMFDVRIQCLSKACKTLQSMLNISAASSAPADFVNRFCSHLGVGENFMVACRVVVARATELDILSEFTPPSAVAGCIMLTSEIVKVEIQKRDIAEVCQISVVTITKCHKVLKPFTATIAIGIK
jgi:transcription initiation factor TFIIB